MKNLKINLIKILIFSVFFILLIYSKANASSSSTYFYGEAIKVDDGIDILSDEISIDIEKSKIVDKVIIQNKENKEKKVTVKIPLNNKDLSVSVNGLEIKINGTSVKYKENENGEYEIVTKMTGEEAKRIDITYNTDNNLKNAKVIKYNFDNYKGKEVKHLKVETTISEEDIPLIEKIYPGHYVFENNVISIEYYNYEPTAITKNVAISKETFNNLLYRREDLSENEKKIIKTWKDKGIDGDYSSIIRKEDGYNSLIPENEENINSICKNIGYYVITKNKKYVLSNEILNHLSISDYEEIGNLIYDCIRLNKYPEKYDTKYTELKDKIVCVEYVETEQDKEIYADYSRYKIEYDEETGEEIKQNPEYKKVEERTLLKSQVLEYESCLNGAKIIIINEGVDGENLGATEKEIAQYINSINADILLRLELFSGELKPTELVSGKVVGYYSDSNYQIAKEFIIPRVSEDEKEKFNDYYKNLIKLDNSAISDNVQIPVLVDFIGKIALENGKYVFDSGYAYGWQSEYAPGTRNLLRTLESNQAKKIINDNKNENNKIKEEIDSLISKLNFANDEEEIQVEIEKEEISAKQKENQQQEKNEKTEKIESVRQLNKENIYVFIGIGSGILICITILVIRSIRRRKNNETRKKRDED